MSPPLYLEAQPCLSRVREGKDQRLALRCSGSFLPRFAHFHRKAILIFQSGIHVPEFPIHKKGCVGTPRGRDISRRLINTFFPSDRKPSSKYWPLPFFSISSWPEGFFYPPFYTSFEVPLLKKGVISQSATIWNLFFTRGSIPSLKAFQMIHAGEPLNCLP